MTRSYDEYSVAYDDVVMARHDGVLEVRLTTEGGPLVWAARPHRDLSSCFADIAADPDNLVVILTGTGDRFCTDYDPHSFVSDRAWTRSMAHGRHLYLHLLEIPVPVIGAINGPCHFHTGLAVLHDLVIAADDVTFQDPAHFQSGVVPGDGVQVVWPTLLGENRGRYFLLTNELLAAPRALELGVVSELHPRDVLLDRARELAARLARRSPSTLRYTRMLFAQRWRRLLSEDLAFGLAVEGLALEAKD